MKKQFVRSIGVLIFLIATSLVVSCRKTDNHVDKQDLNLSTLADLPDHSNNPYDDAGYWHNEAVEYLRTNLDASPTKPEAAALIRYFSANEITDPTWDHEDNQEAENVTNAVLTNPPVTSDNFTSADAWTLYSDLVDDITTADFETTEYDDFKALIVAWENNVIEDNQLPQGDKEKLLIASSIMRWSGYYWINTPDVWPNPNYPNPRPGHDKWWQVALGDVVGGVIGSGAGPGGAVIGAALLSGVTWAFG